MEPARLSIQSRQTSTMPFAPRGGFAPVSR